MKKRSLTTSLCALILALSSCVVALADTIRLRDGSVIRGQIISFRDQQFTVLIGSGARGRRSQITLYMEDVESIEFEAAAGAGGETTTGANTTRNNETADNTNINRDPVNSRPAPVDTRPAPRPSNDDNNTRTPATPTGSQVSSPTFFQINVRVRADNTSNGWTNTGLVVRRGQRLRITSSGRVSLGAGQFSTPTGLPRLNDANKLMRNEPTGGLIAVIGDDNDEFLFIGSNREVVAQRDGILFLGVNEGNLNDNTGTYDTTIEAEALAGGQTR
ncbi:MAG TPA: hypothetical protein VNA19_06370 [Pyrinomonadaceae bacterium]|jgi:hypothetical protein|nr:hypothetical protein [Pyrinomonadaceae bacterium]